MQVIHGYPVDSMGYHKFFAFTRMRLISVLPGRWILIHNHSLCKRAFKAFVAAFPSHREQWLSRLDAIALVDAILPQSHLSELSLSGPRGRRACLLRI